MFKKGKKTHQSPSSKTKADEERKNWSGFYLFIYLFFSDCEYRGLEFWGWQVGNGTSANESVSKKTKKEKEKKRIRSKERDSVGQWVDF